MPSLSPPRIGRVLDRVAQGSRVLIIRLRSLGDCVLTTPALALLKSARPDLKLAVVVEDRFRPVFEGNPSVDAILPPRPAAVHRWGAALCLNLHGGSRSAVLTAASGARWKAGFAHFRHRFLYNVRIPTAQQILGVNRKVHTCEHLASAVFELGVPMAEIPRARLCAPHIAAGAYAVLHPVASQRDKTWPAERFLALADHLKQSLDLEPIFIGAHTDDLTPFHRWRTIAGAPLASTKSLLQSAMLFAGNDSGPAHMAAAFSVPGIVVFGSSDPVIWGPWRAPLEVLHHPAGIAAVTVDHALAALSRLQVYA